MPIIPAKKNYLRSIPFGCERGRPCSPRGWPPSRIRDRSAIRIGEPIRRCAPMADRSQSRRRSTRAARTSRCNFPAASINHDGDRLTLMTTIELICLHFQFMKHINWHVRTAVPHRHLRIIFIQIDCTCNYIIKSRYNYIPVAKSQFNGSACTWKILSLR